MDPATVEEREVRRLLRVDADRAKQAIATVVRIVERATAHGGVLRLEGVDKTDEFVTALLRPVGTLDSSDDGIALRLGAHSSACLATLRGHLPADVVAATAAPPASVALFTTHDAPPLSSPADGELSGNAGAGEPTPEQAPDPSASPQSVDEAAELQRALELSNQPVDGESGVGGAAAAAAPLAAAAEPSHDGTAASEAISVDSLVAVTCQRLQELVAKLSDPEDQGTAQLAALLLLQQQRMLRSNERRLSLVSRALSGWAPSSADLHSDTPPASTALPTPLARAWSSDDARLPRSDEQDASPSRFLFKRGDPARVSHPLAPHGADGDQEGPKRPRVTGKIASLGGHTLSSSAATASGDAPAAAAAAAAGTAAGAETGAPAEAPRVPQAELDRLRRERYQALQEQAERERQRREKAAKRAAAEAALARLGRPGGGYKLGQLDTYDRA